MPDEQVQEGDQDQVQEQVVNSKELLERLEAIARKQDAMAVAQAAAATVTPPEPTPEPTPPPVPPVSGRISRKDYDSLAAYAAAKTQEAERFRLASKFGLEPSELERDFESPQAMEAYAHMLQLQKQVQNLEQRLQGEEEGEEEDEETLVPTPADTGGPTGQQAAPSDLEADYARIREMGRTVEARHQLLQAIYRDPSRRMGPPPVTE